MNTVLRYDKILGFGIIKTTIVGTFLSISLSEIITISLLRFFGIIPREHIVIAFIAPLIITPIIIILFFKLLMELRNAKDEVKILSGLLPICANCKKVRDDKGYWNQIETYVKQHSEAEFSHSLCPECSDNLYGEEDWYIKFKNKAGLHPKN